jgi:TolB-like protein
MKRCPECRRDYFDDSLMFCLDDGAALLDGPTGAESQTRILPGQADRKTELLSDAAGLRKLWHLISRLKGALLLAALVALIIIGGLFVYRYTASETGSLGSIAVMPFANASGDPGADYLSDGISEALINSLTDLKQLRVVARATAFRYKGREIDPRSVGRELNVRAVLMGTIKQVGDKLDVQVDLVDANTGTQIWGEYGHADLGRGLCSSVVRPGSGKTDNSKGDR